jgi:glycosyltransferase involved in cell wall biosynthesis
LAVWDEALAARGMDVARDGELDRFLTTLRADLAPAAQKIQSHAPVGPLASTGLSGAPLPGRVLLATHGLSRQGAPRFLLEYGRALAAAGVQLSVVSAEDGPLRDAFAALGAQIAIVDADRVLRAATTAEADAALNALLTQAGWASVDLVVANSFTTFWAVHAAKAAGRPVLMYVHESTTPAGFYGRRVAPPVIALAEAAFALADFVSFTSASTRAYHLDYGRPERHRLTSGWVDVAAIDRWLARQDRDALRREFGLQPGEQLVCNIGTVSDRKGQHTFARAVDLLWRRYPALAARTKFILLGGRDSPFDAMLGEALAELGRDNLIVHPETSDYLRYYLAADIVACSSYEESSPLVVFEAMACGAPLIASAVHGIPELARADLEARLLPAGDTAAWCEGLARMLAAPATGRELSARARARIVAQFDWPTVMPRHFALAGDVATGRA